MACFGSLLAVFDFRRPLPSPGHLPSEAEIRFNVFLTIVHLLSDDYDETLCLP